MLEPTPTLHNEKVPELPDKIQRTLSELAPEAKTLLLAVSGGPDSVALLRLLVGGPYRLYVAHFDHALRPDSQEDAAFVRSLCEAQGLPFHTERAEVARIAAARGWNLEDAARRLRYSFLTRTAKRVGADAVVTGHTLDDQAETVLMQLLRGAAFLKGMPMRRGRLVRPLLETPRGVLLAHLESLNQPFREDATNADPSRTRAWLRQEVLPLLGARYPNVKGTLARLAQLQRDHALHFEGAVKPFFREGGLDARRLAREDAALQRYAVAELLERSGVPADLPHLEAIRRGLADPHPTRISLPKGKLARLAYGRLEVLSPEARAPEDLLTNLPAEVDPDKLAAFPGARVRTRSPGDRIRLPGGAKKLSDLLTDRKVPRESRDALRVLASGEQVLWVEGVATDVRVAREDADVRWMRLALEEAARAAERGELPVGAVVVWEERVLGRGANTTEFAHDPTGHAEMHALREAAQTLGDWRLAGCTLYVTLEPCPMCFGAALSAHLPRIVYGASNRREGALGGVHDLREAPWKRDLAVRGGVLAREAGALLSGFFEARRAQTDVTSAGG